MGKCSSDKALRDINELINHGVLRKSDTGGRSKAYELAPPMEYFSIFQIGP